MTDNKQQKQVAQEYQSTRWRLSENLHNLWSDLYYFGPLTGSNRLDGSIDILLGLYIGSHPAANMLDTLLFMKPDTREGLTATTSGRFWLLLNLLTILAARVVIFSRVLRFV